MIHLTPVERQLFYEAIDALGTQTHGAAKILRRPRGLLDPRFDAQIGLELEGQKVRLLAKFKKVDRRPAIAPVKEQLEGAIKDQSPRHLPLLVAPYMTEAMAEECRRIDLPFADTAGNLFVRTDTMLLCIVGRRRPHHLERSQKGLTPAGMKVIFALLCRPELAGTGYRQIAAAAQVALGAVGPVLQDLERRGFLHRQGKGTIALERAEELLHEWVVEYPAILRPKLRGRHYKADRNRVLGLNLKLLRAYWGGEVAAERLTGYLKPENLLVYTRGEVKDILIQGRMRLAAEGGVEVLNAFWNPELDRTDTPLAPPLLVYADLVMTGDSRNIEMAKLVYDKLLLPSLVAL